jgi:hypothetical protein
MEQFRKGNFDAADEAGRATLCAELGNELTSRVHSATDFHAKVSEVVGELRQLGHDLWSFDESDEMEVWCPNYDEPTGPGIVVTFTPDDVRVEWSLR